MSQFLSYVAKQNSKYNGGKVLASFSTNASGGLKPGNGFFDACNTLKTQGNLHGIFVWSADDSKSKGFCYEKQSQTLLTTSPLPWTFMPRAMLIRTWWAVKAQPSGEKAMDLTKSAAGREGVEEAKGGDVVDGDLSSRGGVEEERGGVDHDGRCGGAGCLEGGDAEEGGGEGRGFKEQGSKGLEGAEGEERGEIGGGL